MAKAWKNMTTKEKVLYVVIGLIALSGLAIPYGISAYNIITDNIPSQECPDDQVNKYGVGCVDLKDN